MSFTFIIGALVAYLLGLFHLDYGLDKHSFKKDIREFGKGI